MGRQSRIKRLISRRLARRLGAASGKDKEQLDALAEQEALAEIEKMRERGWKLVARLDNGEGVFTRDDQVVALHIQLDAALYKRLDAECKQRETTKRQLVTLALQRYLEETS